MYCGSAGPGGSKGRAGDSPKPGGGPASFAAPQNVGGTGPRTACVQGGECGRLGHPRFASGYLTECGLGTCAVAERAFTHPPSRPGKVWSHRSMNLRAVRSGLTHPRRGNVDKWFRGNRVTFITKATLVNPGVNFSLQAMSGFFSGAAHEDISSETRMLRDNCVAPVLPGAPVYLRWPPDMHDSWRMCESYC